MPNKKNIFPYKYNNVEFHFSAASYDKPELNSYQFLLEGNDKDWSQWSKVTSKEYTNLSYGDYTFRVRSKNIYGVIANEDSYSFSILSPWYLSWWAFIAYVIIFAGFLPS